MLFDQSELDLILMRVTGEQQTSLELQSSAMLS